MDLVVAPVVPRPISMPDDLKLEIFKRMITEDDKYFGIISLCCKSFYKLSKDDTDIVALLKFEFRPEVVRKLNRNSLRQLRRAYSSEIGNMNAKYLVALYLVFNGNSPRRGLKLLKKCDNHSTPLREYVYAIALFKVDKDSIEAENINYGIFFCIAEYFVGNRRTFHEKRREFRSMLQEGKWSTLKTTTWCLHDTHQRQWNREIETIRGNGEYRYRCLHCLIDIETFKLAHNIE